jgi:hypothetical protein
LLGMFSHIQNCINAMMCTSFWEKPFLGFF